MTDIVERLRAGICDDPCRVRDIPSGCECAKAAARIEQLEAALRDIEGMIPHATPDYSHRVWTIARAALEVKND